MNADLDRCGTAYDAQRWTATGPTWSRCEVQPQGRAIRSVEGSLPPRLSAGRSVLLLVGQQQVRATLLAHRTVGTATQADVLIALKDVATLSKGRAVVSVPVE